MTRRTNPANNRSVAVSKHRRWSSVCVEMTSLISRFLVFFMDHQLPCGASRFNLNSNRLNSDLCIGSPSAPEFLRKILDGEGVTLRILAKSLPICSNIRCALLSDIVLRCATARFLTRARAQELLPKSRLAPSEQGRGSNIPPSPIYIFHCDPSSSDSGEWRNGRRWGLKIPCPKGHPGSTPGSPNSSAMICTGCPPRLEKTSPILLAGLGYGLGR